MTLSADQIKALAKKINKQLEEKHKHQHDPNMYTSTPPPCYYIKQDSRPCHSHYKHK